MNILKKRAQDITVGESIGLSLGIMLLSCIPFVITGLVESGYFDKKKEEDLPEEIMAIEDEEETSE